MSRLKSCFEKKKREVHNETKTQKLPRHGISASIKKTKSIKLNHELSVSYFYIVIVYTFNLFFNL